MYHGRLLGETWPWPTQIGERQEGKRGISTEELFFRRYRKHSPEYFIISRGWWKQEETKALRTFLTENFPVAAQGDTYVVFDLRRNLASPGGSR
jgi:hypothetical protein